VSDEYIDVPTTAALAVREPRSALIEPAADFDTTVAVFTEYQKLRDRLLTGSDFQQIGNNRFVKKSGWRKLAVAFGVSDEIIREMVERDDDGKIIRAECVVRAIAPNGRYSEGVGVCDQSERRYSKPEHDIPATAHTRAKSRACSDLFGFGEVSAEEMQLEDPPAPRETIQMLVQEVRDRDLGDWVKDQGFPWPWTAEVCEAIDAKLLDYDLSATDLAAGESDDESEPF
jgi:hypothetical protein